MAKEAFDPDFDAFEEDIIDEAALHEQVILAIAEEGDYSGEEDSPEFLASQYMFTEIQYIRGLYNIMDLQERQQTHGANRDRTADNGMYFYSGTFNSLNRRYMEELAAKGNLVIGGYDGTSKSLTTHKYVPGVHKVMLDDEFILPAGADIVALTSEIGIQKDGNYQQIYPSVFSLPNFEQPGIAWDILTDFILESQKSSGQFEIDVP